MMKFIFNFLENVVNSWAGDVFRGQTATSYSPLFSCFNSTTDPLSKICTFRRLTLRAPTTRLIGNYFLLLRIFSKERVIAD